MCVCHGFYYTGEEKHHPTVTQWRSQFSLIVSWPYKPTSKPWCLCFHQAPNLSVNISFKLRKRWLLTFFVQTFLTFCFQGNFAYQQMNNMWKFSFDFKYYYLNLWKLWLKQAQFTTRQKDSRSWWDTQVRVLPKPRDVCWRILTYVDQCVKQHRVWTSPTTN